MPLVSVIMPVYNGEVYLGEAIESILAQTFTDFELLIVDDGSTDSSAEIIRSYEKGDSRIRFMRLGRNTGTAEARRRGYAEAKGDFITGMDCDDVSLPLRLERQVDFLQSNPEIGAVGTCSRVTSADLTTSGFEFRVPLKHALIALNMFFGASFVGATLMARTENIAAAGGYTGATFRCWDLDLSLRLLFDGTVKLANLPDILMLYRRHDKAISVSSPKLGYIAEHELRSRALQRLWGAVPAETVDRFQKLRAQKKLGWADRRAAKKDLSRLIEALITHKLVDQCDKALMVSAMNRRLEEACPRRLQQFMHWRRHRLGF